MNELLKKAVIKVTLLHTFRYGIYLINAKGCAATIAIVFLAKKLAFQQEITLLIIFKI